MKKYLALLTGLLIAFSASADLCLENFDDVDEGTPNQTSLGEGMSWYESETDQYYVGYWYAFSDVDDGGASVISAEGVDDVVENDTEFEWVVISGNGVDGTMGLHVTMDLVATPSFEYPYAAVGFNFTETDEYHDLCGLSDITFQAKGSGDIRVKLMTDAVTNQYPVGDNWGDMGKTIEGLTTSWQTFTVASSDIEPQAWSPQEDDGLTWADACDMTNKLHFQSSPDLGDGDQVELYLDNIMYHGTNPTDWESAVTGECSNVAVSHRAASANAAGLNLNAVYRAGTENVAISFDAADSRDFSLGIYNSAGQLVKRVSNISAGSYNWNTEGVTSGMYLCKLRVGEKSIEKAVSVIR